MKAYSLDLRERVVAACHTGLTQPAVAAQFSVSLSFVAKLLRRQRTSGRIAALAGGRGPAPRLDAAALVQLTSCLRQTPDATLDELCVELAAVGGPAVSRSVLGRVVQELDWRRKKRVSTPPNATPSA
jgi:transposase